METTYLKIAMKAISYKDSLKVFLLGIPNFQATLIIESNNYHLLIFCIFHA